MVNKIRYKAEDRGIRIVMTEEAYTSKTSFLDNEKIGKHSNYMGRRVHRGVFKSPQGILINAAGNIGRKVFPMLFTYGIVDLVNNPLVPVPY